AAMAHSQEATPPGPLFLPPTRFSVMPMERSAALRYNVRLDRPLRTDYGKAEKVWPPIRA
ncbi:MAG TPA: hypothetical protein VKV17_12850, partial [Bryobacteraceae bacterium]|nr:hypothetical protein [Bryobacteraceae bacterium]